MRNAQAFAFSGTTRVRSCLHALTFGAVLLFPLVSGLGQTKPAPPSSHSGDIETVRQFVATFNAKNVDGMLSLVTDDIEWLSIDGRKIAAEAEGKDALRKSMTSYFRSCPTCRSELDEPVAAGSRITAFETATWEVNGVRKKQRSLSVYEFRDGRIRRVYYFPAER